MKDYLAPTHSLIRIRGSASIQEAAMLMCDMSMGALGVDNPAHEFAGFVTERDLMLAMAKGLDPIETLVEDVANPSPVIVDGPVSIETALHTMMREHVRHLIVRHMEGLRILSMRDLLNSLNAPGLVAPEHITSIAEIREMFGTTDPGTKNRLTRHSGISRHK